jgi:selenide,water dikinase
MVYNGLSMNDIALTQTVQRGGCAAKLAAHELRDILSRVRFPAPHDALLVDGRLFDDAAIYKVTDEIALVQTLDFFTPIVDTPKIFGAIAATNALSDVYAMGGRPQTAMAILAAPLATLDKSIIVDVLQGASDTIGRAGATFVGGHSIDDDTLKFGLSVTGFVHPEKIWSNAGARVGDVLILTKPLGTGTCTAALKRREATEQDIADAIESMMLLNNVCDLLSQEQVEAVHAATDVTGFGFSGHAQQLAQASGVSLSIEVSKLPMFTNALTFINAGFLTKAHVSNASYTKAACFDTAIDQSMRSLIHDPQTSGGLLLSVSPHMAENILRTLHPVFPTACIIGGVNKTESYTICYKI